MLTGIYFISSYFLNYQQLSHPSCINSNTKIKYLNIANIFQLSLRTCLHYVHHADLGLREPTYPPFKNFVKFSKKICFGPSTPTPTNSNIPWNPIGKNFWIHTSYKTPDISEDHTEFYIDNGVQGQIKISLLISIITLTT